jgi:hypothetical protein
MPPKRKGTYGAAAGVPSKPRTTSKYSGNGKKYADKYGSKSVDWNAVAKLADAAVAKNLGRTIETQRSEAMIVMKYRTTVSPNNYNGFDLVGLNQNWNPVTAADNSVSYSPTAVYNQVMTFNLSAMSQVKGSQSGSISGWRQGHKINALALTFTLTGEVQDISADCEYHILLARRKDGAHAGGYQLPALVPSDQMGLFKPLVDGPFASSNGDGSAVPDKQYIGAMARNTDVWSFVEKGHVSKKIFASPQGNSITSNASVNLTMYHSFGTSGGVWDFTTQTAGVAPVLKGGDYYVFVWREGATDTQMEQNLRLYTKLSYKDA